MSKQASCHATIYHIYSSKLFILQTTILFFFIHPQKKCSKHLSDSPAEKKVSGYETKAIISVGWTTRMKRFSSSPETRLWVQAAILLLATRCRQREQCWRALSNESFLSKQASGLRWSFIFPSLPVSSVLFLSGQSCEHLIFWTICASAVRGPSSWWRRSHNLELLLRLSVWYTYQTAQWLRFTL